MNEPEAPTTAGGAPPAVAMLGITKRFPGVVANDRVNFEARVGEVHALLGENGAGKSTLTNILTGLYQAEEGEIHLDGRRVSFATPRAAIEAGIGMVHQHFRLVQSFTVAENVVLGLHARRRGARFRSGNVESHVAELSARYQLPVDPGARIWQLSVGERQRVELLKILFREARVLVLDEPTAVLTPHEAESLFVTLRRMAAEGRTVIFISHKLDEVMAVSDRVTVLRDGCNVGTVDTAATSARELARLMVGREVVFERKATAHAVDRDTPVLELRDVEADGDDGRAALHGVTLTVHAGEIVGVAGVAGNGQRELADVAGGTRTATSGDVVVAGRRLGRRDPRAAASAGVAYVPEDRLGTGLAPSLSIADNLALRSYRTPPVARPPFVRRGWLREHARDIISRFAIKAPGADTPVRLLSGGNVQKVLIAREFSAQPRVLIAASPTRGLDVGAIENVRGLLLAAAASGTGVLLVSEDLDEVLALSDRIAVMYEGRIVGIVDAAGADVEEIGLLMAGATT